MKDERLYKSAVCCGKVESPIDDNKLQNCYKPNGETYPLCKGQKGNNLCRTCNVYEDMEGM